MTRVKGFAIVFLSIFIMSCTWVKITEAGRSVVVSTSEEVSQCRRIGTTTVSVLEIIGRVSRNSRKVQSELETLARNKAALRDADTIVAEGGVIKGERQYTVYQCGTS